MPQDGVHSGSARLRWLLVLIVLLAVTPIFALYLVRLHTSSDDALRQANVQATELARAGAQAHLEIATQAQSFLEVLAQIPLVRRAEVPQCELFLRPMLDGRPWLSGIFVVGPDGRGLCGANPLVRTLNVSDRGYFREAVEKRRFVVSDIITSRLSQKPVVAAVLPLYDTGGELTMLVGVTLGLSWINEVAAQASAKFGGVLLVLDRKGGVIAHQPSPAGWDPGAPAAVSLISTIMQSPASAFEADDSTGVRRIFGITRLPDLGVTVAVGLNRSEVLGPIESRFRTDVMFLLAVLVASIAAALALAEFGLLRGVRQLKNAALRLKAGRMGVRVQLSPYVATELHDLAATYNAMTAEFERLAYLDRLTGLPNRRYLERHLMTQRGDSTDPKALTRQAVLAIDLDGFKPVNDTHGHAVGDRVLAIIARRIASVVDTRGLLFRVGGDEFAALLPLGTDQGRADARALGEAIRVALEQPIDVDGVLFPVACSIGIALAPDDAETLSGALVVADAALYEAKRCGRNRVVDSAPPLAPQAPTGEGEHWTRLELGAP